LPDMLQVIDNDNRNPILELRATDDDRLMELTVNNNMSSPRRNLGGGDDKKTNLLQWKVGFFLLLTVGMSMISIQHFNGLITNNNWMGSPMNEGGVSYSSNIRGRRKEKSVAVELLDIGHLKQRSFPHGTFFYGNFNNNIHHSEEAVIDRSSNWTNIQRQLLDDEDINIETEKKRCASYNWELPDYSTTKPLKRRRIFYGALIADDSKEVLQAVSTEAYNIFHTVSLIESNATHNLTPRKWRFFGSDSAYQRLNMIQQLYGPNTKVSVDYYSPTLQKGSIDPMYLDYFQREGHTYRWKMNGMESNDIAIIGDLDETYTRDFLRSLQICNVPYLRPEEQDCKSPKIIGATLVFESSPECAWKGRR